MARAEADGSATRSWLIAFAAITLAYAAIFALVRPFDPVALTLATLRNSMSLTLSAAVARLLLLRLVGDRPWRRRQVLYLVAAPVFSLAWYWLLTVLGAVFAAGSALRFAVAPFLLDEAAEWQLFQGLFAFAALAAWIETQLRAPRTPVSAPPRTEAKPLLVRVGDEMMPVDTTAIVTVTGADDYAELALPGRKLLVRTTLGEFERLLDPASFVRVHRSAIVNLSQIERAEPAGNGRMTIAMNDGSTVQASRQGARLLRAKSL